MGTIQAAAPPLKGKADTKPQECMAWGGSWSLSYLPLTLQPIHKRLVKVML